MASKILLIEDDPDISELVQYNLEKHGYTVVTATNGEWGLRDAVAIRPSAIILDVMLPGINGLEVCKRVRADERIRHVPIVMLTAKSQESDVVVGLELGADDYITKPFSPSELMARLGAVLRRGALPSKAKDRIECGALMIDTSRHEVCYDGDMLQLTLAEFKLITALARRPGHVFTREQLLECIGSSGVYLVDRNVDVHIRSIRKKLGKASERVATVRGVGYKWVEESRSSTEYSNPTASSLQV